MRRRSSLPTARVVAATLVTVTTIFFLAYGIWTYIATSNREYERLDRVVKVHANEMAVALALPVWNIDRPQIERIIDGLGSTKQIAGVVVEAAGKTHARARNARGEFISSDGRLLPAGAATQPIMHEGQQIGRVWVYGTEQYVQNDLWGQLIATVGAILLIDVLIVVTVYLVLWRAVLRPVTGIERYAVAVSEGARPVPAERGFTAEVESLGSSIETMVHQLDQRYDEVQESEQRFRTIFNSASDAIFIYDDEKGRIVDANRRFCTMFGYTPEEIPNLPRGTLSSGIDPYTGDNVAQALRASLGASPPPLMEWQLKRKDRSIFWAEISARVVVLGNMQRIIVVARDITQRKEMEQALRRSETMSAMGALVGGVAHEVRNPLFSISAILDAYAEELRHPDLLELASGLRQQVSRLTQLMAELLEFGRPGTTALSPGDLRQLIAEAVASRARSAAEARVELRSSVPPGLFLVPMDWSRLRQVFENLIDNAVQHSPAVRTVTIMAAEVGGGARQWVECRVEDDGSGFRPDDLQRVFEPFFTRRASGIGLGLSIVQRIVEEHGGRVRAENRPGGGAVIVMRLPLEQAPAEAAAMP